MNIKKAKELIKNTVEIYLEKDELGRFKIAPSKQRPIFLLGAPGIGKTAIMEQISQELNIPLVSYSLTHHTRQSALGLPFVKEVNYEGKTYNISEYTMSEIIASIYEVEKRTGKHQGILFIDEINCVSETLYPSMLQFLQFKTFGKFKVPDDWIIVTAGNPTEYNDSAKAFDIVVLDRLKKVEIEPDYKTWKEYAYLNNTHPSILAFLENHKNYFYRIETDIDGKRFATARGWSDLSNIINAYEQHGFEVDLDLIIQYIQSLKIAKEFHIFYDLFNKYKQDFQVEKVIDGTYTNNQILKIKSSKFDERYAMLTILLSRLGEDFKKIYNTNKILEDVLSKLRPFIDRVKDAKYDLYADLQNTIAKMEEDLEQAKSGNLVSSDAELVALESKNRLSKYVELYNINKSSSENFDMMKQEYNKEYKGMYKTAEQIKKNLTNSFNFMSTTFGTDNEMVIFLSELSVNLYSSCFIAKYGCDEYHNNANLLNFYDRKIKIIEEIDKNEA